jgi:hypothetical protein
MRGRPITPAEYEKMLKEVPAVRPKDYVDLDADDMAEELWKAMQGNINTFINTPSLEHKKDEKESG